MSIVSSVAMRAKKIMKDAINANKSPVPKAAQEMGSGASVERHVPKLKYHEDKPYFSTLTGRYYASYYAAVQDSLRNGGCAYIDFNLYRVHENGTAEIVY